MPPKRRPSSIKKSLFDMSLDKITPYQPITKGLIKYLNKKFMEETKLSESDRKSTARDRASAATGSDKQAFNVEQLYSVVTYLKKDGKSDEEIKNISLEDFVKTYIEIQIKASKKKRKTRPKKRKKTYRKKRTKRK